jgi:hypothetical protein
MRAPDDAGTTVRFADMLSDLGTEECEQRSRVRGVVRARHGAAATGVAQGAASSCRGCSPASVGGSDPITLSPYDALQLGEVPEKAMQDSGTLGVKTAHASQPSAQVGPMLTSLSTPAWRSQAPGAVHPGRGRQGLDGCEGLPQ